VKNVLKSRVLFVVICLVLALFPVFTLSADDPVPYLFTGDDVSLTTSSTLPKELPVYIPQSIANKASMGAISENADYFMSTTDFSHMRMDNSFAYAGVDSDGLKIGFAAKFGSLYFGVAYGGSLINELAARLTNGPVITMEKKEEIIKQDETVTSTPGLVQEDGSALPIGETISDHTLGLIVGTGRVGFKFGFAEYLKGTNQFGIVEDGFESSLKPSLEVGFNFKAGSLLVKPAIRAGVDMHQFYSNTLEFPVTYRSTGASPTDFSRQIKTYQDYMEPFGGLTLGFDFGGGGATRAEFDLIADVAMRLYNTNTEDGVVANWTMTPRSDPSLITFWQNKAPDISDLRITANPTFIYSAPVSDMLTIGAKVNVGVGYGMMSIEQTVTDFGDDTFNKDTEGTPHPYSTEDTNFSIKPELGFGATFNMLPDHFAMHAGFGILLFSYEETVSKSTPPDGDPTETTTKLMGLPSIKFAVGFSLNFTENVALELLAAQSGTTIDGTKITALFSFRK
jgi:hypothetical protein